MEDDQKIFDDNGKWKIFLFRYLDIINTCFSSLFYRLDTDVSNLNQRNNDKLLTQHVCNVILGHYQNELKESRMVQYFIIQSMFNFDCTTKNLFEKVEDRFSKIISRLYSVV